VLSDIGAATSDLAVFREGAIATPRGPDRRDRSPTTRHGAAHPTAEPKSQGRHGCAQQPRGRPVMKSRRGRRPPGCSRVRRCRVIEPPSRSFTPHPAAALRDSGYEECFPRKSCYRGSAVMQGMPSWGKRFFTCGRVGIPANRLACRLSQPALNGLDAVEGVVDPRG